MATEYKVLGVNDDKDFCSCCGKTGLSKVVWMEDNRTGEVSHFGIVCASKLQFCGDIKKCEKKFKMLQIEKEYSLENSAWEKVDTTQTRDQQIIAVGKLLFESGFNFTTWNAKQSIKQYLNSQTQV